tara:strand:- start:188 stop:772 length:585 start_codon:yes stop_codon:yes gene_type:complete
MTIRISKPAFNLREKITQLEGRVPFERMPVGSMMLIGRNTSSNRTNISSNSSWTNIVGADIEVHPRLASSLLEIHMNFTMEAQNAISGIGFRIYRQLYYMSNVVGPSVLIYDNYQHSHWGTGNWTGPGTMILEVYDNPYSAVADVDGSVTTDVTTKGTSIYYYAQGYKETGNNLYVNYGQDAEGLLVTVKEIRQ